VVFYSRPYDNYLPCDLKSCSVIKKFNTAFIPYYYALETDYKFSINDNFIRNITYFFADQESTKKYFDSRRKRLINKGYQHSYNFGYPALEDIILKIDQNKNCDNFIYKNKNRINVMWTPRWTIDEKLGGSNFLKYYKDIFRTFNNNSKYSFVFRPHPMLFSNFLDNNFITHEEYNLIIKQFKESDNMIYDNSSEYFNTFINTDVLISDNSSIIIEYLLTGKPMIYCFNKSNFVFNEIMNELLDVNYIVNNFDELSTVLGKLTNGIDPKKNKRIELINKIKNENRDASNNIATVIKNEIIDKK
jgi:CDP-glycerol glycerophosphotransferase (TagB/SpsB family)